MGLNKIKILICVLSAIVLTACSISFKFNGSSINYDRVKTISIAEFPIQAEYVYAPLGVKFNEEIKNIFVRQTRLKVLSGNKNADLQIDGEITGYNQYNQAVSSEGYASEVKLTLTVNVRFVNNTNHEEDFNDRSFSAYRTYDANKLLTDVQDVLIEEMVKEIVEQIFNATVANW